jgi:5-methylcytosine-specific restriction endonuclease McrBC GTP-binding regulatory subunit McrB
MSTTKPVGCRACGAFPSYVEYTGPQFSNQNNIYNVKRIENTVRVPSSEYTMNKSALNVYTPPKSQFAYVNWNQMSDRAVPGVTRSVVPSHGNSTKSSLTRMRPGSTSAPGKGVDMKHGSYDRYLARLKGKSVIRTNPNPNSAQVSNNAKSIKWGIAYSESCINNC